MQVISYNSRLFTENEQKTAIMYRELGAVAYALEIYDRNFNNRFQTSTLQYSPTINQFLAFSPDKALLIKNFLDIK